MDLIISFMFGLIFGVLIISVISVVSEGNRKEEEWNEKKRSSNDK